MAADEASKTKLGRKRRWLDGLRKFDRCLRRIEVRRGEDGSFGEDERGEGGSSFVGLEDVIDFISEVKTQMSPSESPCLDWPPVSEVDWVLNDVLDSTSIENLLQVRIV